jgi:hypothetical protein
MDLGGAGHDGRGEPLLTCNALRLVIAR